MSKRYAIFCSGQGAQHATMFGLTEQEPVQILPDWGDEKLHEILVDPAALFANHNAQPMIIAVGLTRWQALRPHLPTPSLIAGYSVGELTAYGVAGALDDATLIALAEQRAAAMNRCVHDGQPHAMMAVGGLLVAQILPILQAHDLSIAIQNHRDRIVVGGLVADCTAAEISLTARGAVCQRLPVTVASHTPLMHEAVAHFGAALGRCNWAPMSAPVLAGVDAQKIRTAPRAIAALQAQLTATIHWQDCMDACVENGVEVVLELGPGNALSRMMGERYPEVACRSVDEFRRVGAVVDWLLRHVG